AADVDAVVVLTLLHEAGDLEHRSLVRLDLAHQLPRAVHAQMRSLAELEVAGLFHSSGANREHVSFRAAGNRHTHGVFRHWLGFLSGQTGGQRGNNDGAGNVRLLHSTLIVPSHQPDKSSERSRKVRSIAAITRSRANSRSSHRNRTMPSRSGSDWRTSNASVASGTRKILRTSSRTARPPSPARISAGLRSMRP